MFRWSYLVVGLTLGCASSAGDGVPSDTSGAAGSEVTGGNVGTSGSAVTGGAGATGGSPGTGGNPSSAGGNDAAGSHGGSTGAGGHNAAGGSTGAGGNGAAGGNAGAGGGAGGAPHTVLGCDALSNPGQWEVITPPAWAASSKNEALSVALDPVTAGVVYAVAGDKTNGGNGGTGIYKSTDCGANWNKISTGTNGDKLDTGDVWHLAVDRSDAKVLYASNGYGSPPSLFKSTNSGVDWTILIPDGSATAKAIGGNFVQDFSIDPTDPKHLLLTLHFNCTGAYAPMCLLETKDGGQTFQPLKGPANGWQEGGAPGIISGSTWIYTANGTYFTSNGGASWEQVASDGWGMPYQVRAGLYLLGSGSGVFQSSDGHQWTKIPGTPRGSSIISDGTNVYLSFPNDYSGHPFQTAKLTDLTKWTNMPSPTLKQGAGIFAYDADHHVVYGACWGGGLLRLVTK